MLVGSFFNLAGPDLIILVLILVLLGVPILGVFILVRTLNRSKPTPPPLPKQPETRE